MPDISDSDCIRDGCRAPLPSSYPQLLTDIRTHIRQARTKASMSVNHELVRLYWEIGGIIVEKQRQEGWGSAVIERLSADLRRTFPNLMGFSPSNIRGMRSFYLAYSRDNTGLAPPKRTSRHPILQQAVGELRRVDPPPPITEIPWRHNMLAHRQVVHKHNLPRRRIPLYRVEAVTRDLSPRITSA